MIKIYLTKSKVFIIKTKISNRMTLLKNLYSTYKNLSNQMNIKYLKLIISSMKCITLCLNTSNSIRLFNKILMRNILTARKK